MMASDTVTQNSPASSTGEQEEKVPIQITLPRWVADALTDEARIEKRYRKQQIELILERHAQAYVDKIEEL